MTTTKHKGRQRTGKSLIEMMVVVLLLSVVFGMIGQVLHQLARTERGSRTAIASSRAAGRLARDFRRDARSATLVQQAADGTGIHFDTSAGTVDYAATAHGLQRRGPQQNTMEGYEVGASSMQIEVADGLATLTVAAAESPGTRQPRRRELRVVAAIGADRVTLPRQPAKVPAQASSARPVEAPRP